MSTLHEDSGFGNTSNKARTADRVPPAILDLLDLVLLHALLRVCAKTKGVEKATCTHARTHALAPSSMISIAPGHALTSGRAQRQSAFALKVLKSLMRGKPMGMSACRWNAPHMQHTQACPGRGRLQVPRPYDGQAPAGRGAARQYDMLQDFRTSCLQPGEGLRRVQSLQHHVAALLLQSPRLHLG